MYQGTLLEKGGDTTTETVDGDQLLYNELSEKEDEGENEPKEKSKKKKQNPASQRDEVTIPRVKYNELTSIEALWKYMEKAIKHPLSLEEETQPAKFEKVTPPTICELLERRKYLMPPGSLTNGG